MAQRFVPQPYPLYAVTVVGVDSPPRFELTAEPVRMVLGWMVDDDGTVLPALAGSPALTIWDGAVIYEETRQRADATAKLFGKADRSAVRDSRVLALLDRVDSFLDRSPRQ